MTTSSTLATTQYDLAVPQSAGVTIRGLSKRYDGGSLALDQIDLECPPGEITVLVGPSGCGKTTLLRLIAGLEQATSGEVWINGDEVTSAEPQARGVAMVFQNYALYPDKTAYENIAFPLRMARVPKNERSERIDAVAELLRIGDLLDRKPAQMSGGQRQRVGIGRALVRGPQVLLMDEPLSNLDAQLRVEMRGELLALQRELGTTMVYVTHDQVEALTLGSTVVVMNGGKISQSGAPADVYSRPENAFVAGFLGGMNLIDGQVGEGRLLTGEMRIELPKSLRHLDGRRITLGIRPESLRRGRAGQDQLGAAGPVVLTELLGSDRLVHIGGASSALRVREEAKAPVGDAVEVFADSSEIHVFVPDEGGKRVELP